MSENTGGPFVSSSFLTVYSVLVWGFYNILTIYFALYSLHYYPYLYFSLIVFFVELNLSFLFYSLLIKKFFLESLNSVVKLVQTSPSLDFKFSEVMYAYFPLLIFLVKIPFDYRFILKNVSFGLLNIVVIFFSVAIEGMIYMWLLCIEKIITNINKQIKNNSFCLTLIKLKPLMIQFLDVQEFIFFISKSIGVAYLFRLILSLVSDVYYLIKFLPFLVNNLNGWSLQTLHSVSSLVEGHIRIYMFLLLCFRSQRLNQKVQKLKWTLEEIQAKNSLTNEVQQAIYSFDKRMNLRTSYFSASGIVDFNLSLVITVLNKFIVYLFAIVTLDDSISEAS